MLTSTALYKRIIHTPHRRDARIDAYDINGNVLAQDVPIVAGSVSASLTSRVTRAARFTLSDSFYPRLPTDPFSPFQGVVKIRAGVRYGDGTRELFPVFSGRIYDVDRDADGSVTFQAEDFAADVIAFRFERPRAANEANTILAEIKALVLEAYPQAVFKADGVADAGVPQLAWDEDRGQALDDLANALGGRWFPDGDGFFSVQPIVYEPSTPLQDFLEGPGGLMSQATTTQTRNGTANSVTVVSERTDGSEPVRVTRRDTSPASPTFFGGNYGRVSEIIKIQTPLSVTEADRLAQAQLESSIALTEQWTANVVPDYTMEPGDTVKLGYRGLTSEQVIDNVTYPLMTNEDMTMDTRGTVLVQDA